MIRTIRGIVAGIIAAAVMIGAIAVLFGIEAGLLVAVICCVALLWFSRGKVQP